MVKDIRTLPGSTSVEVLNKSNLAKSLRTSKIPNDELLDNLGLYLTRQYLSRVNLIQKLYNQIVDVPGIITEFGVRWGGNMALFSTLRGMLEPYNYSRKIIGFDTFSGFPSISDKDGINVFQGDYSVTEKWESELNTILEFHEANSPIPHKKKFELVKGDASITLPDYLQKHPETVIALAYFDFDIYEPTKACLEAILPCLTKGSILVFDELCEPDFPGETVALKEVIGLQRYAFKRDANNPLAAYCVIE